MFEEKVKKFTDKLSYVSRIASFIILLLLTADIVATKCFNWSITGAKAFTEMLMVLLVFMTIPYVTAYRTHIVVDLINFKPMAQHILDIINYLLGIGLCGLLTWRSVVFIQQILDKHQIMLGTEGWLDFPLWIPAIFLVFGYGLTTLIYIMQFIICIKTPVEKPE